MPFITSISPIRMLKSTPKKSDGVISRNFLSSSKTKYGKNKIVDIFYRTENPAINHNHLSEERRTNRTKKKNWAYFIHLVNDVKW